MAQIDFEGNQQTNPNPNGDAGKDPNNDSVNNAATQQDTTHLDGGGTPDITGKDNKPVDNPNPRSSMPSSIFPGVV